MASFDGCQQIWTSLRGHVVDVIRCVFDLELDFVCQRFSFFAIHGDFNYWARAHVDCYTTNNIIIFDKRAPSSTYSAGQ